MKTEIQNHSCSIRGERELSLSWKEVPINWHIVGALCEDKSLLLRRRNSGRAGYNIIKLWQGAYLITNIAVGGGSSYDPRNISFQVKAKNINGAARGLFNLALSNSLLVYKFEFLSSDIWGGPNLVEAWDFTQADLTDCEIAYKKMVNHQLSPEEVGLSINQTTSGGMASSMPFYTTIPPTGWRQIYDIENCLYLTIPEHDIWFEKNERALEDRWMGAIASGGTTTVISCKGMAKTEVPNGTLVEYGEHPDMILPTLEVLKHYNFGSGRNFGYAYTKTGKFLKTEEVGLLKYWVAFSQPKDKITQIFGCRDGAAQLVTA